jgi:hypothetical protein
MVTDALTSLNRQRFRFRDGTPNASRTSNEPMFEMVG